VLYQVTAVFILRCEKDLPVITFYFYKTDHFVSQKFVFFHLKAYCKILKVCSIKFVKNNSLSKEHVIYFFNREHCHLQSQNETNASLPPRHLLSNHRPLSSHAAAAGQLHMAPTVAHTAGSLSHTPTRSTLYSQLELEVSSTGILERIKNFTISKSFI
jgi:hypothetical protein